MELNTRGYLIQTMDASAPVPLPRGRHKLGREQVRDSQRERLVRAMLGRVAEQGYADTKIADVVAAARVSPNVFYELFEDKEDCFLEACDEATRDMLEQFYALAAEPSWTGAVRKGMKLYLRWWEERPGYS